MCQPVQPDGLVAEQQFIAENGGIGKEWKIRVKVPRDEKKKEFQFKGQTLTFTMKLNETVEVLKQRIHAVLTMPINKMKLRVQNGIHLKDGASLAFFNVNAGTVLELSLKVRGGSHTKNAAHHETTGGGAAGL